MRRWKKHYLHPINKFMECAENMQGKGNYLTSCLPPIKGALSVAARTFCFRVWRFSEIVCVKNQILCYRGHILIHTKDKGIWLLEGLRQTQGLTRTSQGFPQPCSGPPTAGEHQVSGQEEPCPGEAFHSLSPESSF